MTPDRLMRLVVWLAVAMPCTDAGVVEAHKPVTSKYTYYEHIQPLFRFYCGGCHRPDGIAPMSLLSYETTYPWAESIKEHLLAPSLHPYHDDESYGVFRHDHRLTPRELDRIVDWADGGTPQGVAPADTLRIDTPVRWILGPPDRTLTLPEVVLGSEETEKTQTFVFPLDPGEKRRIVAFDLVPQYPGIVHDAVAYLTDTPPRKTPLSLADTDAKRIVGVWLPGLPRSITTPEAGHDVSARYLAMRVHYRKNWRDERTTRTDRSVAGLYFSRSRIPQTIRTKVLWAQGKTGERTVLAERRIERDTRLRSVVFGMGGGGVSVEIALRLPDGSAIGLLRVAQYDPGWPVRYEFAEPVSLPSGSRVIVTGLFGGTTETPRMAVWIDHEG